MIKNLARNAKNAIGAALAFREIRRKNPTCHIYPGVSIDRQSRIGEYNVIFANTSLSNTSVGSYTNIQKNSRINNATIGKFCSIASRVSIGLGKHPTHFASTHPVFYGATQSLARTFAEKDSYAPTSPIAIGHDVWIGENAMILDGVKVGTGAVIGMGAVVVRKVPEYAIVLGNPGQVFMYRFEKDLVEDLLSSEWWNMPDEWLKQNHRLFADPRSLIKALRASKSR